jgi:hypothetical protein
VRYQIYKHTGTTSKDGAHHHKFWVYYRGEKDKGTYSNRVASGKGDDEGVAEWKTNKEDSDKPHPESEGKHRHSFTTSNPKDNNGNNISRTVTPHENRPPYFALVYLYYLGDKIKNELKKGSTISVSSN